VGVLLEVRINNKTLLNTSPLLIMALLLQLIFLNKNVYDHFSENLGKAKRIWQGNVAVSYKMLVCGVN
jgi:hypothetical protein